MESKNCLQCGKIFEKKKKEGCLDWNSHKYCSNRCFSDSRIGKKMNFRHSLVSNLGQWAKKGAIPWNKGKKVGDVAWNKGMKGVQPWMNMEGLKIGRGLFKGKKRPEITGEKNTEWKGESVGYFALHTWIHKKLGKANHCSFNPLHTSTRFQWANISGQYLRDVDDWASLCPKCHRTYDLIVRKPRDLVFDKIGRRLNRASPLL